MLAHVGQLLHQTGAGAGIVNAHQVDLVKYKVTHDERKNCSQQAEKGQHKKTVAKEPAREVRCQRNTSSNIKHHT